MRLAGVIGVLFALLSLVLMSVSAANDDPCKGNPCINGNCTALSVETNGRNFSCACNAGYDGDLCDNDINDCAGDPCKNGGACTDGVNAFTCNCTAQWKGDTCETDVDECAAADLNNCHTNATCANIDGGFTCDCKPGFTGNGTSCEDVDECAVGPCKNNGVCTNKENAFQCNCTPQWTGATCEKDVDECDANTSDCHQDATCTNTDGGFNCTCDLGFSGNGTFCEDINECAPTPCKNDGTCVNKVNAFECYCTVYWKGDTCDEDVNECDGNTHNCHSDATCANTDGGFNCSCKSGFNGNGTSCTDIDECSDGTNDCHSNATCTNNDGGFKCECIKGYDGNGTFCVDINECTTNTDDCHQDAICTNTDSSFECACKSGYTGNGTHCEDVDECAEGGSNDCHADALCINIGGGFKCSCKVGFDGNGTFCAEVDECAKDTDNCHKDADCTNSVGSFTCECKFGYKGNGTYCEDIHECAANPCQNGGGCRDLIGNYSCTCEAGWTGKNCTDEVDMCTPSPCVNGGNCTNLRTTYTCKCPMKFKGENCEKEILLYDFGDTGKTSTLGGDDVFLEENTRGSFPLCGSFYEELPINVNGYIAFDDLIRQAPRLDGTGKPQFDSDKTMIAPFWSDISTGQYGKMKIQSYSEINAGFNSIKDRLKQDLNDNSFIAKFVLVVTWHKVSPSPSATYEGKEEITFQVAMVTDYMKSYAIFNYDSDMMTWKEDSDPLRTILIGYQCGGSHVHTHVATETPYLVWNETNVGKPGRFVYEVGPINDLTMCNVWYNEQKSHDVTPLLELTPACPCAKSQASADADYESVAGTDCFVTKTKSDNDTLQRCCYGSSGALLKGYPGGGYISTMLSEGNSTLDGYSKCCDGPDKGFCGRFYKLRPSDNCARYSKNGAAKPPIFNNTEITLTATVGEELTLTLAAQPGTPDGTVSYTISAPSTDDFKYTLANGVFKWTPTNTNKTFSVRFVAKDDGNNLTAVYWPKIRLCNCGSKGNCQELGTVANEDRFYHADCKCFGGYTGRRCDQDPCSGKPCYTECTLDPGTRAGYKCSKCPDGLVGDGVRCNDVNECALETDTCQQVCINTLGSYRCSCMDGYQLVADNRTCTDINECITSKPCTDPAEDCKNTPGGHECNCRPDFFRKKNKCTRATAKFTVSVAMKDGIPGQKWDEVKDKSSPAYKALVDKVIASVSAPYEAKFKDKFVGVEVLSMKQGSIVADTGIYFSEPSPDITKESVTKTLVDSAPTVGSSTSLEGLELDKPAAESLFVTADSCRLSLCDETSSDCTSHDDGSYTCVCKPGFEFYSPTMCLDLDECKDDKKCMDGVCINTPGDYLCECNTGYMFNKTSKTCKNTCDPSQCKNGKCEANYNGYFCKCNDGYAGMNCEREDKEAEYLRMVAITVGAVGAGVILLLILLLVIACCKNGDNERVSYRKNSFTPNASTSLETWNPSLPRPQLMNNPQYEMKEKRKSGDAEEGHVYDEATPMASRNQGRQQGVDNQAFSETSELNGASKRRNKKNDKTDADYF